MNETSGRGTTASLADQLRFAVGLKSDSIFTRRAKNATPILKEGFRKFRTGVLTENERNFFSKIRKNHASTISLLDEWKIMNDYNNGVRPKDLRESYEITEDMFLRLKNFYDVKPYLYPRQIKSKNPPIILTGKLSGRRIRIYNKTLFDFVRRNGPYYVHFHKVEDGEPPRLSIRINKDSRGNKLNVIKNKGAYGAYVWVARLRYKLGDYNGKICLNTYTDDKSLESMLMEINGMRRLSPPQIFLKASLYRQHKNTAVIQINCRELARVLKRKKISSVYVDIKDGYCAIEPTRYQPSVKSYVSYLQNDGDHVRFSVPKIGDMKIRYVGLSGISLTLKNLFMTNEEFETSRELLSRGYTLRCGSYHQAFDIEILQPNGKIKRSSVIQITSCNSLENNVKDYVISDVYSCEMFSRTTTRPSIIILNEELEAFLTNFNGFNVCARAKQNGVNFFFVDFSSSGWSKEIVDKITKLV